MGSDGCPRPPECKRMRGPPARRRRILLRSKTPHESAPHERDGGDMEQNGNFVKNRGRTKILQARCSPSPKPRSGAAGRVDRSERSASFETGGVLPPTSRGESSHPRLSADPPHSLRSGEGNHKPPRITSRQRGAARAQHPLHRHGVEPAAEFEAHIRMGADHLEAGIAMDGHRAGIGAVADHRNHLPEAL